MAAKSAVAAGAASTSQLVQNFEKLSLLDERARDRLAKLSSAAADTQLYSSSEVLPLLLAKSFSDELVSLIQNATDFG
jgi:hypothetical protein